MKQRNGVLGLETAKQVMVAFLILAVTGVAIILSLTAIGDAVGDTIDNVDNSLSVTNESDNTGAVVYANITGYTLAVVNSSTSGYTLSSAFQVDSGVYNISVPLANLTLSSAGVLTNATVTTYNNLSISYDYTYTVDRRRVDNIVGNVSGGLETFFASTGTIFSILIVVVIILAISVIIWAVGRFGERTEQDTTFL